MPVHLNKLDSELKRSKLPVKEHENDSLEEVLAAINKSFHHLLNPPGPDSMDVTTFRSLRDEIGVFLLKAQAHELVNEESGRFSTLDEFIARIAAKDFGRDEYSSDDHVVQWLNEMERLGESSKPLRVLSTEIEEFIEKMMKQRKGLWRVNGSYVRN